MAQVVQHLLSNHEALNSNPSGGKKKKSAECWWNPPAILATQEPEIRRIAVPSQHRQIVFENLS
jgi:hypothetical protein